MFSGPRVVGIQMAIGMMIKDWIPLDLMLCLLAKGTARLTVVTLIVS